MADQIARERIRLEQTLHGYEDGHRLLSSSISVKPRDLKTMLMMSDASGPGAQIASEGYLTGYPLADSGVYALGRTWAATEVSRPGCVWTHTLLLRFEDLATLPQMNDLIAAFRRPQQPYFDRGPYEKPLYVPIRTISSPSNLINREMLAHVLIALYDHPKDRIIASSHQYTTELVMSLWAQQWPRLRRSFRFCTLAFGDRSSETANFDLQFVPADLRSIRSRFSGAVDADRLSIDKTTWVKIALKDLLGETDNGLRTFLRQVGADVTSGREAFPVLCRLYQLMPSLTQDIDSVDEAFELIGSFRGDSGKSARKLIVSTVINNAQALEGLVANSILKHLDLIAEEDVRRIAPRIGYAVWSHEPQALLAMLDEGPPKSLIAEETLAAMSLDHLIDGLTHHSEMIPTVLKWRPELLTSASLWAIAGAWQDKALAFAAGDPNLADRVLLGILRANRTEIATKLVQTFGSLRVLNAIAKQASEGEWSPDILRPWVAASVNNAHAVAEFLGSDLVLDRMLVFTIAQETYPDFVPNEYGEDPWWTAARKIGINIPEDDGQYVSAYLLARALGYVSRNQAELIQVSFDNVYSPLAHSRLSQQAWSVIDARLPRSWAWFFDWDSCQRLLDAVAVAFIDRELSPITFTQVTKDDYVFKRLAKTAANTVRGRQFLQKAIVSVTSQDQLSERQKMLQELI